MDNVARTQEIEKSIMKQFRRRLWTPFIQGVKKYKLIEEGDKIAVCISGGKDSSLCAKLLQELHRHSEIAFELEFLIMDPGYNPENRQRIEENLEILRIPAKIFDTDIFDTVAKIERSPCYLCARMRRGYLYKNAKDLGCNKIALGHHFNDVIETTLMGMLYGAQIQTMMPKLHSTNFEGMELIRPLYMVHEEDIIAWRDRHELKFLRCACRFTENCVLGDYEEGGSKRQEMKLLIRKLKKDNPHIDTNIFNSIHNVNLDTLPGFIKNKERHSFLETYE
ncbi:MAG: tRNA 2-thiocytidine biosynthesis protein TtcA [Lachnospiraceae bacterium]|jgi:tRNA(Ile)-lysidine synthase TilS/MesJ|nr:tRNA 2-thiocytidine biosynthesis protein TtcA [Lachnospiraceae bacterium]